MMTCIELHMVHYIQALKPEKSVIIKNIVSAIEVEGGRFLKRGASNSGGGEYTILSPRSAREKVGLAMREYIEIGKRPVKSVVNKKTKKNASASAKPQKVKATARKKIGIQPFTVSESSSPKSTSVSLQFVHSHSSDGVMTMPVMMATPSIPKNDENLDLFKFLSTLDEFSVSEDYPKLQEIV